MARAGKLARPSWFICGVLVLMLFAWLPGARALEQAEAARIQALLQAIKTSGVSFIRNGETYTAARAAEHFTTKWERGARYVHSAEDFIEKIASRSSTTGDPYLVILPDGRRLEAGAWLRGVLKTMDRRPGAGLRPLELTAARPTFIAF